MGLDFVMWPGTRIDQSEIVLANCFFKALLIKQLVVIVFLKIIVAFVLSRLFGKL